MAETRGRPDPHGQARGRASWNTSVNRAGTPCACPTGRMTQRSDGRSRSKIRRGRQRPLISLSTVEFRSANSNGTTSRLMRWRSVSTAMDGAIKNGFLSSARFAVASTVEMWKPPSPELSDWPQPFQGRPLPRETQRANRGHFDHILGTVNNTLCTPQSFSPERRASVHVPHRTTRSLRATKVSGG